MKYQPMITKKMVIFDLYRPIFGSFYGIWDKWLKIAKKRHLGLVVNTKEGTATYKSVEEFLKGAKKMERFYKDPNEPMIFWGKDFLPDIKKREERKKIEKKVRETNGEAILKVLEKMKEKQPDLFEKIKSEIVKNPSFQKGRGGELFGQV